jgi:hypothetical protein
MHNDMKNSEGLHAVPVTVTPGRRTWSHSQEAWEGPTWDA